MAKLLFLGASVSQLPAIRYARTLGHEVVACDGDPHAVAFPFCDVRETVDFSDVESVVAVGRRERVDGVLAISTDRAVVPAAVASARLGLPGIGIDVARAMTHKPAMRRRLAEAGVPQPPHTTLTAADDPSRLSGIRLPGVLKPADSGGQRGLFLVERPHDLAERLPEALAASRTGEAIFEEYVDGSELNTLFAVRDGAPALLTVSDRLRPDGVGFGVGWIHRFPSQLPDEVLAEAVAVASHAIEALGLRDGIAFPQVLASTRGVFVVEVAARIAAGQMADLVRHATGIEVYDIAFAQALGEQVPDEMVTPKHTRPVAIRFLTASPGLLPVGTVTSIAGLDDVRRAPGVLDAGLYFDVGAHITPLQVDADRRGYVIATAADASGALALAEAAARRLRVETGGPPPPVVARRRFRRHPSRPRLVAAAACLAAVAALAAAVIASDGTRSPVRHLRPGVKLAHHARHTSSAHAVGA